MILKNLILSAFISVLLVVPASASAANVQDFFKAIQTQNFEEALSLADVLDQKSGRGDLFKAFANSVAASQSGDCKTAINLSKIVIRVDPNFLPAFNIYGKCLVQQGKRVTASKLYQSVADRLPKGPQRQIFQNAADKLKPSKKIKISASGDVTPSSNITRRTDQRNALGNGFVIDEESAAQKGVTLSGQARLVKPLFQSDRLLFQGSILAGGSFDTVTENFLPKGGLELRGTAFLSPKASVYAAPFYELTLLEGKKFYDEAGLRLGGFRKLSPKLAGRVDNVIAYRSFANADQSAKIATVSGQLIQRINKTNKITYAAAASANFARNDYYDQTRFTASVDWEHLFENGLISSVQGSVSQTNFERTAALSLESRRDKAASISLGLSHQKLVWKNLRPQITYRYTRSTSNDPFFDFKAQEVNLNIKAAF